MPVRLDKNLGGSNKQVSLYTKQEMDEILLSNRRFTERALTIFNSGSGGSSSSWGTLSGKPFDTVNTTTGQFVISSDELQLPQDLGTGSDVEFSFITATGEGNSLNWFQAYNNYVTQGSFDGSQINFTSRDGNAAFSVVLGELTVSEGAGIDITTSGTGSTITHYTPTTVASSQINPGTNVIQTLEFDQFGHAEDATTIDLSGKFAALNHTHTEDDITDLGPYDNYQHWTLTNGTASEDINPTETVSILNADGTITVSQTGSDITLSANVVTYQGGDNITIDGSNNINHDTSAVFAGTKGGTAFDYITSIDVDTYGHLTSEPVVESLTDDFYTKANLQSSGTSQVHWGNITNEPTFDNYQSWQVNTDDNTPDNIGSTEPLLFSGGTDIVTSYSAGVVTISFDGSFTDNNDYLDNASIDASHEVTFSVGSQANVLLDLSGRWSEPGHTHTEADITDLGTYDNYQSWQVNVDGSINDTVTTGKVLNFVGGTDIDLSNSSAGVIRIDYDGAAATDTNDWLDGASIDASNLVTFTVGSKPDVQLDLDNIWSESGHSHTVSDLSDTSFTSLSSGDLLQYNGTNWVNSSISAGVDSVFGRTGAVTAQSGDYTASQVDAVSATSGGTFSGNVTADDFILS